MRFITDTSVVERLMTMMLRFPGKGDDCKVFAFGCIGKVGKSNLLSYYIDIQNGDGGFTVKGTLSEIEQELEEMCR